MSKFIYTQDQEVYEALKRLGLIDFGEVQSELSTYMLANPNEVQVPDALKGRCLFTDRMFFVAGLRKAVKNNE